MKKTYGTILTLAVAVVLLLGGALVCGAAEDDEPRRRGASRRPEMTDEMAKRILARMAESNPEKAKDLKQLWRKDPEKFRVELRKSMREQFAGRRQREQRGQRASQEFRQQREKMSFKGRGAAGMRGGRRGELGIMGRGRIGRGMRMREVEHLEWLEKNFPEKAKELAELREKNPELYMRRMALSLRKYGRIAEAERENPELAKILRENLELNNERNELLRKIKAAKNDSKKEKLVRGLKEIISTKFDLLVRRKQIAYEQLLKRLERLRKELKESKGEVEKWKNTKFKNEKLEERLEELLSGNKKFRWE